MCVKKKIAAEKITLCASSLSKILLLFIMCYKMSNDVKWTCIEWWYLAD
jgi:hypothetical protein